MKIGDRFRIFDLNKSGYEPKEPEWNAENMNRKQGDTTFEMCGWCEHTSCGSVRYGCYLSSSCSLLREYGLGSDVKWNTPCIFKHLGKDDLKNTISGHKHRIEQAQYTIKNTQKKISIIEKHMAKRKNKPILPYNRKHNHFNVGDALWVFFDDFSKEQQRKKYEYPKWYRGIAVIGYRHHDGCISYCLDEIPESSGWGCGTGVPYVMLESEMKYFLKNPEDFKIWLEFSDKGYGDERLMLQEMFDKALEIKMPKVKSKKEKVND